VWLRAVEVGRDRALHAVGRDDGADVAVEEVLVVVVAQLDELVARAELAVDGLDAAGAAEPLSAAWSCGVEVADAGDALVHRGEDLHVVDGMRNHLKCAG
jgi:hypothetical protein